MSLRVHHLVAVSLGTLWVAGCGSDQKNAGMDDILVPASAVTDDAYGPKQPDVTPVSHNDKPSDGNNATSDLNDEQKAQIRSALKRAGANAEQCIYTVPGAKTTGEGEVQTTFDGKSGHVSDVSVGAPFAGTEIEECIKKAFKAEYSLTFDGPPLTVPYTIKVAKSGPPPKPKK